MAVIETDKNNVDSSKKRGLLNRAMNEETKPAQNTAHGLLAKIEKNYSKTGTEKMNVKKLFKSKSAIVENYGIFTIQKDLEVSSVKIDPSLKALVDSVLR